MMQKYRFLFFGMIFFLCALLAGCGNKDANVQEEYKQGAVYQWTEGPVKEISIPSVDELMEEKKLSLIWQSETMVSKSAVWKMVAAKNEQKENKTYYLFFPFEKAEWVMMEADDCMTQDGIRFNFLTAPIPSLSGETYTGLNRGEEGRGIALISSEGVGKYAGPIEEGFADSNTKMMISRDGKVYEWLNSTGNVFASDVKTNRARLLCVTETGEEVTEEVTVDGWILGAVQKDDDSHLLFYGMDQERTPAMWDEDGRRREINFPGELSAPEFFAAYTPEGNMAFLDKYGLWEATEADVKLLYSFMENGYRFDSALGMVCGEDDRLLLLMSMDDMPIVLSYDISKKNLPMEKKELVLAMSMPSVAFNNIVADFNRYDPDYYISIMVPGEGEDTESFQRRIQLELTSGKGPDLMEDSVLYDVNSMKDKGFLMQLDERQFESGGCIETALATGMIDGGLYGVPYEFSLDFAAYHKSELGDAQTLTVEEMMEFAHASEAKIVDAEYSAAQFILKYALSDESNTDYINWKEHKSNLLDEKFLKLLAFAKEYTVEQTADNHEIPQTDVFAAHPLGSQFTLSQFKTLQESLGDYLILGYPRNEGNGIYMWTNRIYVNAQSDSREGAVHFLQYLVGEKAQALYVSYDALEDASRRMNSAGFFVNKIVLFPINRSILEKMVEKEDGNNPENQFVLDSGKILYLKQPLSEEQISEFWYLVDHSLPAVFKITPLEKLIYEELDPYFEGQRSVEDAAEKLNNRVQLYLDETK